MEIQGQQGSGRETVVTRKRAKMGSETDQLKAKVEEELERTLTQLEARKNEEIRQLRVVADEAHSNLETAREHSASLEQELRSAALQVELDRHRALDALRAEHQKALEREQQLVDEEKKHARDWIADLKSGFELETLNLRDKVSQLEKKLKTPEPDPASATAHVLTARDDGRGSTGETQPTDPTVAPTPTASTAVTSSTVVSGGAATVTDSVTPSTRGSSVTTTDAGIAILEYIT